MIDFGRTAADYATHRAGFPDALFDRLAAMGVPMQGATVLDLGTGTGTLARGFARRGARVTALDPAAPLLEQARKLDREAGVSIEYRVGRAEETGLSAASFDIVAAGQCWHWFDRPRAAAEAMRLLRPGGRLIHAHLDWLPLPGTVAHETEALILKHTPSWSGGNGTGLHGENLPDLSVAGFEDIETFSFDLAIPYTHAAWRGRIRASAGIGASLPEEKIARFDREHAALLAERFPEHPLRVPHRLWAALARKS
jgi:SAM-dependent methyltransferase